MHPPAHNLAKYRQFQGALPPLLAGSLSILYIAAVCVGPYLTVSFVWMIADIFNGLMSLPNIVALFALSGVIAAETKKYFDKIKKQK